MISARNEMLHALTQQLQYPSARLCDFSSPVQESGLVHTVCCTRQEEQLKPCHSLPLACTTRARVFAYQGRHAINLLNHAEYLSNTGQAHVVSGLRFATLLMSQPPWCTCQACLAACTADRRSMCSSCQQALQLASKSQKQLPDSQRQCVIHSMLLVPCCHRAPVEFVFLYVQQQDKSSAAAVLRLSYCLGAPAELMFLHALEHNDVQQHLSCLCPIVFGDLPSFPP